jgi:hypothetical protein
MISTFLALLFWSITWPFLPFVVVAIELCQAIYRWWWLWRHTLKRRDIEAILAATAMPRQRAVRTIIKQTPTFNLFLRKQGEAVKLRWPIAEVDEEASHDSR